MKTLLVLIALLGSAPAIAATIYLNPGDEPYFHRGDTIICTSHSLEPEVKWQCECFNGEEKTGTVKGLWARTERVASSLATEKCGVEFSEHVSYVSCVRQ